MLNETEKNFLMDAAQEETKERREASLPVSWKKSDGLLLLAALLAAGCYFFAHFPYFFLENGHFPGIGLTLTQWLLMGAVCVCRRKNLRIKGNKGGVFLLAVALGLGVCFALFANDAMRFMNLPVLWLTTFLALFSLTGAHAFSFLSGKGLRFCLRRFIPSFFVHWPLPFRKLRTVWGGKSREKAAGVALGVILGLPVALIAIGLLSSADQVFGGLLQSGFHFLDLTDGDIILQILYTLLGGLCLFSFLRCTECPPVSLPEAKEHSLAPQILVPPLAMLSAVYAVFTYVQCRYLLFGSADAGMTAGYAEYARNGFFQLSALAFLTLLLILPCLSLGKNSKAVRALCGVTALLTVMLDYSAFFRMRLYIETYGLSILRLATLWGMLMILSALIACCVKCAKPQARICPALTAIALGSWLVFNLSDPDRVIAKYQVNAYNRGALEYLDTDYLASLSPSVLPELARIEDPSVREQTVSRVERALSRRYPAAYDWAFCWLNAAEKNAEDAVTLSVVVNTEEPVYALSVDFLWNGEIRSTQGCVNAKADLPLDGRVDFTLEKEDLPEGLDFQSAALSVQFSASLSPEHSESASLPVSAPLPLSPAWGERYDWVLSGDSLNGFELVSQAREIH